jgi:membrane protease YdiL (CAAX protease family)
MKSVADAPFHRYLNRCFLGIAVIGLWPFLRALGMQSWAMLGLQKETRQWRLCVSGVLAGIGTLALVAILTVLAGACRLEFNHTATDYGMHLLNACLAALVVSILEELLFRGALFGALRRAHGWKIALVASSLVFGLVHFLGRGELRGGAVEWNAGLVLLPEIMRGFAAFDRMIPAFLNLAVVGAILAFAYQRTGSLYFSIGVHGGWILAVKSYEFMTIAAPGANAWFWGTSKLIDGWMALAGLAVALVLIVRSFPVKPTADPKPQGSPK